MRIKLTVAYDGTDFRGWALQKGKRTVQGAITEAIALATRQELEVVGASRTDSGAHARGQVCHFDSEADVPIEKWPKLLNRVLPDEVAIVGAETVSEDFNSRFCAEDRHYVYTIRTAPRDPFRSRYAHDYGSPLDGAAMQSAAKGLLGTHDFKAYTEELNPSIENTTRTLCVAAVVEGEEEVRIKIVGTAFLRGMMRRMAGALLEVGAGRRAPEYVSELLGEGREGMHWPVVLPAKGLTLMRVRYANPPRDHRKSADGE